MYYRTLIVKILHFKSVTAEAGTAVAEVKCYFVFAVFYDSFATVYVSFFVACQVNLRVSVECGFRQSRALYKL